MFYHSGAQQRAITIGEYQSSERKDLGSEGLAHAAWGCGAVDMFLRRGKCLSSPCFEVIRGLIDIFKSCRHIHSHLMIYSVSYSSRNAYKRMYGYHLPVQLLRSTRPISNSADALHHYRYVLQSQPCLAEVIGGDAAIAQQGQDNM
jgi:hypothetical protein